jgi:hypothetical protein
MIRILIEDEWGVVVEALVNVKARRVESLVVETERGLNDAFIAEALVALELEMAIAGRVNATNATKAEPPEWPEWLTHEKMARAMGLVPCKAEWDHECSTCEESTIDWMRGSGQVLEGFCNACLPMAYDDHLIEQAELDRLVEADDGLKPELRAGIRPDAPSCEGGCE